MTDNMGVTIDAVALRAALKRIKPALGRKSALPILSSVLIRVGETVRLTTTDMNLWLTTELPIVAEGLEGAACVPYRHLSQVARYCRDNVRITATKSGKVKLEDEESVYEINGYSASDYPAVPSEPATYHQIEAEPVRKALAGVLPAASDDVTRPVLTGVYFAIENRRLTIVATDSYRLHYARLKPKGLPGKKASSLAPARLWKLVAAAKGDTFSYAKDSQGVHVIASGVHAHMAELVGQYPKWEQLIPESSGYSFTVDTDLLSRCCARTASLSRFNSPMVISPAKKRDVLRFTLDADDCRLVASDIRAPGHDLTQVCGYNPAFLLDAVKCSAESGETNVAMRSPLAPAMVTGGANVSCLVMPIRVSEGHTSRS